MKTFILVSLETGKTNKTFEAKNFNDATNIANKNEWNLDDNYIEEKSIALQYNIDYYENSQRFDKDIIL